MRTSTVPLAFLLVILAFGCSKPLDNVPKQPVLEPTFFLQIDADSGRKIDLTDWRLVSTLGDKKINLKDFAGKVLVIDVWAVHCPGCVKELPSFRRLYNRYRDRNDIAFFFIGTDRDRDLVREFVEEGWADLPEYQSMDPFPEDFSGRPEPRIPRTYIIGRKGMLHVDHLGELEWDNEKVVHLLDSLLADSDPE